MPQKEKKSSWYHYQLENNLSVLIRVHWFYKHKLQVTYKCVLHQNYSYEFSEDF